jgi:hypothetical protein
MTPFIVVLVLAIQSATAFAKPQFARQYKHHNGYIPSCQACHKEGGGTPLNNYGKAFEESGKDSEAFNLLSSLDSDGDGFSNGTEALKKSNPGDSKSTPTAQGNWLDLSSLIPKEVQMLFPNATAWKPLDAILTDQDIIRAQSMGVILNTDDENTIYIPVAERRPIGTALIFPASFQDKTFFLLMTTDRQLNITQITPLTSKISVSDAVQKPVKLPSNLFESFVGKPIQSVTLVEGDTLSANISLAVKRAGVLVYMRLKGA